MKPWKIRKKDMLSLLLQGPKIWEAYNGLECQHRLPRSVHKEVKYAIALARKFNNEVLRPMYLDIDLKCMEDHDYLPWDFVKKAGEWKFYSLFLPKLFGGAGLNFLALYPFIEEISSVCSGLGHIIFVHYLGIATVFPSFNVRIINKVLRDVAKSEKEGNPRLLDLVITEPEAGTDVQEPLLIGRGRIGTIAKKVKGGYVINGRKIFISNGHLSYWHVVMCFEDRNNQGETFLQCVVPNGAKGFSFGTHEKKMGHLASTASDLIFEECFIPDSHRLSKEEGDGEQHLRKLLAEIRIITGAMALGVGRAALAEATRYAGERKQFGKPINRFQAIQFKLAEMATELEAAKHLVMYAAWLKDAGKPHHKEASMAKLFATEAGAKVCDQAARVFASYGFAMEYPVQRYLRDIRFTLIGGGTSEILKLIIAKELSI